MAWSNSKYIMTTLSCLMPACTQVNIQAADGEVQTEYGIGVTVLETHPRHLPQLIRSSGIGIFSSDGDVAVGYQSSELIILPLGDCRIVVWAEDGTMPADLRELATQSGNVCVIGGSESISENTVRGE